MNITVREAIIKAYADTSPKELLSGCNFVIIKPEGQKSPTDWNADDRPWFITFNPYYGPDRALTFYWFDPFPEDEFSANSPYDEHIVIAHHGIERFAEAAGHHTVEDYIKKLIALAWARQVALEE